MKTKKSHKATTRRIDIGGGKTMTAPLDAPDQAVVEVATARFKARLTAEFAPTESELAQAVIDARKALATVGESLSAAGLVLGAAGRVFEQANADYSGARAVLDLALEAMRVGPVGAGL